MHLFFSARPDPSSDALRPRWRERCDRDDERRYFEVSLDVERQMCVFEADAPARGPEAGPVLPAARCVLRCDSRLRSLEP